jgi:hydrogenase nickel incorporation protein HypA/HybF
MHELSIALSIIDIARVEAEKAQAKVIKEIEIDIGTLAGIEFESLEFSFSAVSKNTEMENTAFIINKIKAKSECRDCYKIFEAHQLFDACPGCKGFNTFLVQGNELKVKSILIE